jgi:transcriptional regulator with XRE-family HTH domain
MRTLDEQLAIRPPNPQRVAALMGQMEAQVRAYRLRDIRTSQDITQVRLAEQLHVSQNRISQLENGDVGRSQVDTLRRYVEALGGHLKVEASFDDATYTIVG